MVVPSEIKNIEKKYEKVDQVSKDSKKINFMYFFSVISQKNVQKKKLYQLSVMFYIFLNFLDI